MENTPQELSWADFRKEVFAKAARLVENGNCSNFKIIGWKYLDIRVILYFHDCNQVFDFRKMKTEIKETSFFTVDKEHEDRMTEGHQFKDESERDVPEVVDYKSHPKAGHVITEDDAMKLAALEEEDMAPGEQDIQTEVEFDKFVSQVTGKTLKEFAEWRWPDEPQKQFDIALKSIGQ